jgi:ankyrin repeat protein
MKMSDPLGLTDAEYREYAWITRQGGFKRCLRLRPCPFWSHLWSLALTKLYVENGADVNEIRSDGQTPLIHAVFGFNSLDSRIVAFLLQQGACVNMVDAQQKTVLDYVLASEHYQQERRRSVLILLKHDAIHVQTRKPDTPIREFYFTARSFLVLVHKQFPLPSDLLRELHSFLIG